MAERDENVVRKLLGSVAVDRVLADPTDIPEASEPGILMRWPQTFINDVPGSIPVGVEYAKIWKEIGRAHV